MRDPFITWCIKDLKQRGLTPPYYCEMPCGKRIWFDDRGRIKSTTTAACVKVAYPSRKWKKPTCAMTPAEYAKARERLLKKLLDNQSN